MRELDVSYCNLPTSVITSLLTRATTLEVSSPASCLDSTTHTRATSILIWPIHTRALQQQCIQSPGGCGNQSQGIGQKLTPGLHTGAGDQRLRWRHERDLGRPACARHAPAAPADAVRGRLQAPALLLAGPAPGLRAGRGCPGGPALCWHVLAARHRQHLLAGIPCGSHRQVHLLLSSVSGLSVWEFASGHQPAWGRMLPPATFLLSAI